MQKKTYLSVNNFCIKAKPIFAPYSIPHKHKTATLQTENERKASNSNWKTVKPKKLKFSTFEAKNGSGWSALNFQTAYNWPFIKTQPILRKQDGPFP